MSYLLLCYTVTMDYINKPKEKLYSAIMFQTTYFTYCVIVNTVPLVKNFMSNQSERQYIIITMINIP